MTARALLACGLALLVAVQVVRSAAVRAMSEAAPDSAAQLWPSHPEAQLSLGLTEIATAAREGRPVPSAAFDRIASASRKAPLAAEPFLVRGVQAQLAGNDALAEKAFVEARWRDGRSLPARYFLAEHYLRRRDAARGLREIAVLARLVPQGTSRLAPFVAGYARDPVNHRQLRNLFRSEPILEESTLAILSHDSKNAALVISLADPRRRTARTGWIPVLVDSLLRDRQYARARSIWAVASGGPAQRGELIYDPEFRRPDELPPFNWSLTSSTVGLAERQRGGGLRVIYYGEEDGPLASQLLVLPAGNYRLSTKASAANQAGALSWALTCAATNQSIATSPLDEAVRQGWTFTVPPNCPAQRLELIGRSSETPGRVEVTVRQLILSRGGTNG
jgi:hypothetical protein